MPYRLTSSGRELLAKNMIPADFPQAQLVTPKQVVFKSEDGLEIHGQLFTPKDQKRDAAPLSSSRTADRSGRCCSDFITWSITTTPTR